MKRRIKIGVFSIFVLLIIGLIIFNKLKKYDIAIRSADSLTSITIEKISKSKPRDWEHAYGYIGFELAKNSKAIDKALNSEYFDFSVENGENIGKKYASNMVFLKDGHYFVIVIDDNRTDARLIELITHVVADDAVFGQSSFKFTLPFIYHNCFGQFINCMDGPEEINVEWKDTLGLHSFEDLKTFYQHTGSDYYKIEEDNQAVVLKFYRFDEWTEQYMLRVKATETGLNVSLTQEFIEYLNDEDRESSWYSDCSK